MRVFLCSFNNFSIAIPISFVSSIVLIKENQDKTIDNNKGNNYISLPLLLEYPSERIKHGIILKNKEDDEIDNIHEFNNSEGRIILMTTEIECETEIQDDKIFTVQKSLKSMQFSLLFSGIFFDSLFNRYGNTILLLNPGFFLKKQ
jgi:hypothetical protein